MNSQQPDELDLLIDAALPSYVHDPREGIERRVIARISSLPRRNSSPVLRWTFAPVMAALLIVGVLEFRHSANSSVQPTVLPAIPAGVTASVVPPAGSSAAPPTGSSVPVAHVAARSFRRPRIEPAHQQPLLLADSEQALMHFARAGIVPVAEPKAPEEVRPVQVSAIQIQPIFTIEESK